MTTISTENGIIQVTNETVQWQERVAEGSGANGSNYTPINPREHATGITYNENDLKLSKYTGYNTYETPWRASEFRRSNITYIAIGRKIYGFNRSNRSFYLISDFSALLNDDYFVSVGIYDTDDSSNINCFLTHNGMGYVASGSQWGTNTITGHWVNFRQMLGVDNTVKFTGIATYTVSNTSTQRVVISTTQGLYFCNNASWCQGTYYIANIDGISTDASYAHVFVGNYGGTDSVIAILDEPTEIVGVYRYLTTSGTTETGGFVPTSVAVNNTFHGYKNVIPALNMVVFNDGIWICENYQTAQLNTSDLVRLKDTQYVDYVKEWVSPAQTSSIRYTTGSNKWSVTTQYNYQGTLMSTARYTNLVPMYTLDPTNGDSEHCLQIMNDGSVMWLNNSIVATRIASSGTVELYNNQRAPKFSYDVDIGMEGNTLQQAVETLNNDLVQDGRTFTPSNALMPYSMGTSDVMNDSSWDIKGYDVNVSPNKQYGFVYDVRSGNIDVLRLDGTSQVWTKYSLCDGELVPSGSAAMWDTFNCIWTTCKRYIEGGRDMRIVFKRLDPATGTITQYEHQTIYSRLQGTDTLSPLHFSTNGTLFYVGKPTTSGTYIFYQLQVSGAPSDYNALINGTWNIYQTPANVSGDTYIIDDIWYMGNVYNDSTDSGTTDSILYAVGMKESTELWFIIALRNNGWHVVGILTNEEVPDKGYNSRLLRYGRYNNNEVVAFYAPSGMFCYASWSAIATGVTPITFGGVEDAFAGDNVRVRGLSYLGDSQWIVFGTEVDNPTRTRYAISNDRTWTQGLSLPLYTQKEINNPIQASNIVSSMFYISNNGTVQLMITSNDGCIGTLSKTTNSVTCGTLTQTYYKNNPLLWRKVIYAQGRYIGLVSTSTNTARAINVQSYIIYSDDGQTWLGGYEIPGIAFDMAYARGVLHIAFCRYKASNVTTGSCIPLVLSSCNENMEAVLTFNSADIWQCMYSTSPGVFTTQYSTYTYYVSVDTSASTFVASFTVGTGNMYIVGLVEATDQSGVQILTEGEARNNAFVDKITAVGDGHYCYVNNNAGTMTMRDLYITGFAETPSSHNMVVTYEDTLKATLTVTDPNYTTRISDYDPFYNGVYIVTTNQVYLYTAFETASNLRILSLGNNSNTSTNKGMVKYCHGRFLYNESTAPMYGIVPFFNVNPTDEKAISIVTSNGGTSIASCTYYNDIIFVVDNQGKLYTSKTI